MQRQNGTESEILTRRAVLAALLGGAGIVGCGGVASLFWLANRINEQNDSGEIVFVTATPPPTTPTSEPFPFVDRATWGGLPPNHTARNEFGFFGEDNNEGWRVYEGDLASNYQTVVVHHSVVYEADDESTLLAIQDLHREDRGWADVAYHYFVGQNGIVYEGRNVRARGSHVGGFNTGSVGICLLGDFTQAEPTPPQLVTAGDLIAWLAQTLDLTHIAAHGDFNANTVCPGSNVIKHIQTFANHAGLLTGIGGYIPPEESTT